MATVEEFAMQEYFEIKREQSRLRFLALAIMGAVAPLFISLLFSGRLVDSDVTRYFIAVIMLCIVSFVYLVLALLYTTLSRRYDNIVSYLLTESDEEYDKFLLARRTKVHNPPLSGWLWPFCTLSIFILPSLLSLLAAVLMAIYSSQSALFALVLIPYLIVFCAVFFEWTKDMEERRSIPLILRWIITLRERIRQACWFVFRMD